MDRADVGRYLAGDLTLILLLGWLFYDSFVSVIVLFPGMLWMLQEQKRTWRRRRKREMQRQFLDAIQMMAASLQSGYSVEKCSACVSKGAGKAVPTRYIYCAGISEYGITTGPEPERGELLQDLGERSQVEDLQALQRCF